MIIRRATLDDATAVLAIRNDPTTRIASTHPAPITPDEHQAWWIRALANPQVNLYVMESSQGELAGYGRLDLMARVSLAIHPEHRGLGWAHKLLQFFGREARVPLHADVKLDNEASRQVFTRAGYTPEPGHYWIFSRPPGRGAPDGDPASARSGLSDAGCRCTRS